MQRISGNKIVDLIYRDFKPTDSNWLGDAWDMIGEAVEGIGYHAGFDKVAMPITIANNRAKIPTKFREINHVEYDGYRLLLGGDFTTYNIASNAEDTVVLDPYRQDELNRLIEQWDSLEQMKVGSSPGEIIAIQAKQDKVSEEISKLVGTLQVKSSASYSIGDYYQLANDHIYTSFPTGNITIHGIIFPVDKNNVPLIVDTYKYRTACFFKVASYLLLQGYKHPTLTYELADFKWEDFRKRAANEAKIMGVSEMDRFARMWTRFKPDLYEASTMFKLTER